MRKFKLHLFLFALLGIAAAYTTRPAKPALKKKADYHTYAFRFYNMNATKIYYSIDLTLYGYTLGIDYDCQQPNSTCTFVGDVTREHSDLTGTWFYMTDIPLAGISYGTFVDFDQ